MKLNEIIFHALNAFSATIQIKSNKESEPVAILVLF